MKCEKTPSGGQRTIGRHVVISLCAACTGCILCAFSICPHHTTLPRRCLHGVHRVQHPGRHMAAAFASALPARGASEPRRWRIVCTGPLPRRCLHGVHLRDMLSTADGGRLCLGAACTGCIRQMLPRPRSGSSLPRRCLHGVLRQKPTNCGTPSCSIRRESVDSFSEINIKDSCADYFPALFCCQDDLHRHYRQPRTGNRPVLRCEQHRLFLFILSSHYRRLL